MSQQYEYGYTLEVKGERREQVLGVIPADQLQNAQRKADAANRAERMPGLHGAMVTPATYWVRPCKEEENAIHPE